MTQADSDNGLYDRQADFNHEGQRLEDTLAWIDRRVIDIEKPRMVNAGDVRAADKIVEMQSDRLRELKANRPSPYFGRIDYTDDASGEAKTAYIGDFNSGVSSRPESLRPPIVHRNTPIASLYYDPSGNSLKLPKQPDRKASVYLKRMLTIRQAALLNMEDVLRLAAPSGVPQLTSSEILDEKLAGASEGELSDAVQGNCSDNEACPDCTRSSW